MTWLGAASEEGRQRPGLGRDGALGGPGRSEGCRPSPNAADLIPFAAHVVPLAGVQRDLADAGRGYGSGIAWAAGHVGEALGIDHYDLVLVAVPAGRGTDFCGAITRPAHRPLSHEGTPP